MTLAVYAWSTGIDPIFHTESTLEYYSTTHVAIALLIVLTVICWKAEISFFMQVSSAGVIFLVLLIVYIIIKGFQSFANTDFMIGTPEESNVTDWSTSLRTITLANANFAPVAGILCGGYFLHVIGVPILRNAKEPKNNKRDLFIGYFFVFISYIIIGGLGYIGFIGYNFRDYFQRVDTSLTAG